ncbi:hypothetical protein [Terriglobus tenax]|uniref:hypothetical protein n=1 Tax=Terriglobus tenax TaxID=1111115 RepID=UPI0021DF4FF2|nr:hypothetical protein [Terriglobus tenax]
MKSIVVMALLACSLSAIAADSCAKASTNLGQAERKMYVRSISSNLSQWQPPAQIKIDRKLTIANWTAVWAMPSNTNQSVFVYSQEKSGLVFHDVWKDHTAAFDKTSIVQWVKKLSPTVPDDFANCLAETVSTKP